MNYHDAFTAWSEEIKPLVIKQYGEDDIVALSESWNDYTDMLCKDGELSDLQYHHCPAWDDTIPEDDDAEREYIFDQLGVSFSSKPVDGRTDGDWHPDSRHFAFTFHRGDKTLTGTYSMGSAVKGPVNPQDVFSSILLDTSEIENGADFEEWAGDLGFDTDSRKAERTYKACVAEWESLQAMFSQTEIDGLRELFEDY